MIVSVFQPRITKSTAQDDYVAIVQIQAQRFNGTGWDTIGGIVEEPGRSLTPQTGRLAAKASAICIITRPTTLDCVDGPAGP